MALALLMVVAAPLLAEVRPRTLDSVAAFVDSFESDLERLRRRDRIPGAAAAIVRGGEVVWQGGVGVADRRSGEPVSQDTVFQVASLSKPVAALGVLLLEQDGLIDLDRPIWDYIVRWRPPPSAYDASGVTARRLLEHRGGVGVHGYPGYAPDRPLPSLVESLDGASGGAGPVELVAPPGGAVRYSSGGYTILQLLVEEVTGESFGSFMERRVLRPLGMTHSSFEPPRAELASGYGWWGGRLPAYRFREQASSGLYATAGDLARFLSVLWSPESQAAVGARPATIAALLEPPPGGGFSMGFAIEPTLPGVRMVSHTGANRGFRAILGAAPDRREGFVALVNSDRGLAMTSDLYCRWGAWVSEVELGSCWAERKRRGTLAAVALLLGLGLAMDVAGFVRQRWRARLEQRPRWATVDRHRWVGWVRLSVSLALGAGWWLFWYSDLYPRHTEGIENFVPASSLPPTFFWLTAVVTSWCLLGITRFASARPVAVAAAVDRSRDGSAGAVAPGLGRSPEDR